MTLQLHSLRNIIPRAIQKQMKHKSDNLSEEEIYSLLEIKSREEYIGTEFIEVDENHVASSNVFSHPRLVERLLPYSIPLILNEHIFLNGGQSSPYIVDQEQCNKLEETRDREQSLQDIFSSRYSDDCAEVDWSRKDIKVYQGPGYCDILITMIKDNQEVPAACQHYGQERYVSPDFRKLGLGTELVLIGAKLPLSETKRGTGLYSPGGYASRKKAFDLLVAEFGLSHADNPEKDITSKISNLLHQFLGKTHLQEYDMSVIYDVFFQNSPDIENTPYLSILKEDSFMGSPEVSFTNFHGSWAISGNLLVHRNLCHLIEAYAPNTLPRMRQPESTDSILSDIEHAENMEHYSSMRFIEFDNIQMIPFPEPEYNLLAMSEKDLLLLEKSSNTAIGYLSDKELYISPGYDQNLKSDILKAVLRHPILNLTTTITMTPDVQKIVNKITGELKQERGMSL